ncbi:MAG: transketolase [Gemmatimonadaceae bacterium]|nr:transketolase [Gemmatimonadaceae bacterium]
MPTSPLDKLCIDTVRTLAMDGVQKANSGHPGTPMALAPLGFALFTRHMKHDPAEPHWIDRDRFVLSCGHASMLLYSCLFLSGYDVTLDDLKQFRQWESRTPGHPELGYTPGVETTTGPLGQGVANAVGMAVAEAHLAATFNQGDHAPLDHHTWFICSDGDLMEGISHEAASFAGHFKLGKLIGFYDDNRITIDGGTDLTFTDDTAKRFESYGWQVLHLPDVNDLDAIDAVVAEAKRDAERPTLVVTRTHIGFGSPKKQDTSAAHGEPLGAEEIVATKKALGWPRPEESFYVPEDALAHWREARAKGAATHAEWTTRFETYGRSFAADAAELSRRMSGELPRDWESVVPTFTADNGSVASRAASNTVLNALVGVMPELMGGSADLTPSNGTAVKTWKNFAPDAKQMRYMHFGIREHGMGAIMNGMALHRGVIPFGGTFLIFSDYMRPAIRLACFMKQRVIFIFTHDSIGLGEDGPTHQPIEQLAALRAIPGITVIRPADASETAQAWKTAVTHTDGPVCLVLTRQKLGYIDRTKYAAATGVAKGGYVLADADGRAPQVVLLSSGSEVALIISAREKLAAEGVRARVVSLASHELFARQSQAYRDEVLPHGVPRISIEAASPMSWHRWVGSDGVVIGVDRFGASAPYETLYTELGLTVEKIVEAARVLVATG